MTKQCLIRMVVALAAVIGMGMLAQSMNAADTIPARMDTFTHPDGANYFALSLQPEGVAPAAGPREVIVMFNTSASQLGEYRAKAIEALKGILAGLGPEDRVQLMAADLNAVSLTKTFVTPGGKEMADALAALDARVPFGAADMKKALSAVAESFQGESKNARTVVYLGDGRSAADPVSVQDFEKLVEKFASAHISVSGYIVGARSDAQILGSLAGKTGGVLLEDNMELTGAKAGTQMAAAVETAVLWPTSVKWPAEMSEVFPKQAPPLRLDRDSVVIGEYKGNGPFEVQYEVATPAGPQKITFTADPKEASGDTNSYLAALVQRAKSDGGASLPLIGTRSLAQAKIVSLGGTEGLKELAKQSLSAGNVDGAEKLAEAVLRQDPNNIDAVNVKEAVAELRQGGPAKTKAVKPQVDVAGSPEVLPPAGGASELNLVGPSAPIDDPNAGVFLQDVEHRSHIITQQVQAEVRATIDDARKQVSIDPRQAMTNLRVLLEKVRQVPEINPDIRDQLAGQLQTALQETARRQQEFERQQLKSQESIASAKETQMVLDNELRDQVKVKQLMYRFNALMSEGRYNTAEMDAAAEAQKIMPNTPALEAAKLTARTNDYFNTSVMLRERRQKGVVDALASTENSHIPFDDMVPIVYPNGQYWKGMDNEFWRRISDKDNPQSRINKYSNMDLSKPNSAESDIQQALKEPTQMVFTETALSDVIDYLKDLHKTKHPNFEIVLDTRALSDASITPETPVTKNLKGISLRSALRLLLKDLNLTYMIKDEVLLITTPDVAEQNLTTKVYPVADLVVPIPAATGGMMGGMGGMMGGMGGGMGGMSGGMGGGMGGMGGGMGGMGGGMGMFNMLPKIPQGGFQAFSVKDDSKSPLKAESKTPAKDKNSENTVPVKEPVPASVTSAADSKSSAKLDKIPLDIDSNDKPEVAWDKYFDSHQPSQAAVRDAVRRLMNDAKYDHVIAMIGAALRHQQPQPWMYEATGLAMQAAGRPKEEIERAVMSAVDFAQSTSDLLYIGAYLMDMNLNERALGVFRQAAAIDPLRSEPYLLGLKVARKTGNLDGLRWASLGILSQAWPKEQASIWKAGVGVAQEVIAKLDAEKRTKEADAFRTELDRAVERDCVVVVNYAGDAQLDLLVQEPSGSFCSFRSPRTTSGGMLLGNAISQTNEDNGGGKSEVYVCPKGFDGTYKIAIRRVFGKVATGKVHVKVMVHYLGKNPVSIEKAIPLVKDEAQIAFDLKDGRRKEPIADQQIANAAVNQLQVNAQSQILAQQVDSLISPSALGSWAAARSLAGGTNGGSGVNGLGPLFGGGGAVGYEPKITTLPEGATLGYPTPLTAVISADRRYVRITPNPMFSGIGEVNTFNTFSGESGTSNGGTGGQGFGGLSGGQTSGSNGSFGGSGTGF